MADKSPGASMRKHMPDRVGVSGIGIGAAAVAVAIALSFAVGFVLLHLGERAVPSTSSAARPGKPPPISGPIVLQPQPQQDIETYRAEKQQLLDGYAWIDREHGIVRIPISQAMALLARQAVDETQK